MTIHVLLTADNHLDLSAIQYGPRRFERKRDFQRCFETLVNFALDNRPDLLLVGGDFYDTILPGNPTRAFVAEQFKHLYEKDTKILLVSGHHDTPRSIEQGASPLAVHSKSGHVHFFHEQKPVTKKLNIGQTTVNVTGLSLNPTLTPDQDPLAEQQLSHEAAINILLTHYPVESFEGYFGQETHIAGSSVPQGFQLLATGHLHRHQKRSFNGTPVIYPGSTERVSFQEENEEKGFVWLEIDKTGIVHEEFHTTPARRMETLNCHVTGEGGSLTRQIQEALEARLDSEKILRVQLSGRVSLEQLSTYKRSALLSYCQDRFFHTEFNEEALSILTQAPLEPLPKTTPLQELDRTFRSLSEKVKDDEKPLVQEAWRLTTSKLQEEGVS